MVTRKKTAQKVKFELAKSSIGGIAVVVFCLFLWTFIFGVWAGQSILALQGPSARKESNSVQRKTEKKLQVTPQTENRVPPFIRARKKVVTNGVQ